MQFRIAQLAATLHDPLRARARAEQARATFASIDAKQDLAKVDAFLRTNHWR